MGKILYESTNYDKLAKAIQSVQKLVTTKGRSNGQKWWGRKCWKEKKKLRKVPRKVRKGKASAEEYIRAKKKFK